MPDLPWNGPLTREGVWSGDGRFIEEGGLTWADPPLPLEWVRMSDDVPHGNKVVVGIVDELERMPDKEGQVLWGKGRLFEQDEQQEVVRLLNESVIGPSVDLDGPYDVEIEMTMPSEDDFEPTENEDGEQVITISPKPDKQRVKAAVVRGATLVSTPAFLELRLEVGDASGDAIAAASLIAANLPAAPSTPPVEWFRDPQFTEVTPITVTAEGRVYGHVAAWDQCHTAFSTCIAPPRSAHSYAYFLTGEVLCDGGERIPVGQITLGTGHAPTRLGAKAAASHYDNTGTAVADVSVGEDSHGVWLAGALRPHVGEDQVRALMCSDVSGDWRPLGGSLELIALLSVNVPGFPKARVAARIASGHVESLVASAGPVCVEQPATFDAQRVARRIASTVGYEQWQAERRDAARERLTALKG